MSSGPSSAREAAEALAIQALTYIAGDAERLGRFLAATGIAPTEIRSAASEPEFLAGVLDYLVGDVGLLTSFSESTAIDPETVEQARVLLSGTPWERDIP